MLNAAMIMRVGQACLAGSVLVILSAAIAGAFYGPRTNIGMTYQQSSDTQSTNGVDETQCSIAFCLVLFQQAPQQRPLIVQHVGCRVFVSTGDLIHGLIWSRKGEDFPLRQTPLVPVPTSNGWWAVSSPVVHLIKSGERPFVRFENSTAATWYINCSLSGKLQQS